MAKCAMAIWAESFAADRFSLSLLPISRGKLLCFKSLDARLGRDVDFTFGLFSSFLDRIFDEGRNLLLQKLSDETFVSVMQNVDEKSYREKVYKIVREIPSGKVMTYGQIADILGEGYTARTIGYVMHAANTENVPWQRVINSQGGCSTGKMMMPVNLQQKMLQDEGIIFDAKGHCDLNEYRWFPEGSEPQEDEQPSLFE